MRYMAFGPNDVGGGKQKKNEGRKLRTIAENEQLLALAGRDLAEEGEQVEGVAEGVLAHEAAGVGAAWVEVAEQGGVVLLEGLAGLLGVGALGVDEVGDDVLDHGLGAAVGVGGADGAVLGDGDHVLPLRGVAIDGGRGGEDDVGHVVLRHAAEEDDGAVDVDAVVFEGLDGGLADGLKGDVSLAWT